MVLEVSDVVVREVPIAIKESAVFSDDVKDHLETWLESILKYAVAHDGLLAGVCNLWSYVGKRYGVGGNEGLTNRSLRGNKVQHATQETTGKTHHKTRQDKASLDKARQGKAREGKTIQDKTRQVQTRQDKSRHGKARQGLRQGKVRSKASKTRQG